MKRCLGGPCPSPLTSSTVSTRPLPFTRAFARAGVVAALSLLALLLDVPFGASTGAQPAPRRVLLVHSYEREFAPFDSFEANFRTELANRAAEPIQFFDVSIQHQRFRGAFDPGPILDYVQAMFAAQPPDLIVPIGGPAVGFVRQYRHRLFPASPMLMAAVDQRLVRTRTPGTRDALVAVANDMPQVIETVLQVLPRTTRVFVVVGASPLEQFWRGELERDFQRFAGKIAFTWSDRLSSAEMLKQAATLPPHSAIFYVVWSVDARGVPHSETRALRELSAAANAPIFGLHSTQLGRGIVGGPLMGIDDLSRNAAAAAARILRGEPAGTVTTPTQVAGAPTFDWHELRRWNIPESRLPSGSLVRFRETDAWERYKWPILVGLSVCVGEALLILALVANRRSRKVAEEALRNLNRELIAVQEEERSRVARELHDGVCQSLALLSIGLDMLGRAHPEAPQLPGLQDLGRQVQQLGADVRRISHDLAPLRLEQLGLAAAIRGLCRDLSSAGPIAIDCDVRDVPADVPADVSLCLFRVLQEALQNVTRHSGATVATVAVAFADNELRMVVADNGRGFDATAPRVTTSAGLANMRERLRSVSGRFTLESAPGGGTRIEARVPWAAAHEGAPSEPAGGLPQRAGGRGPQNLDTGRPARQRGQEATG